MSISHAASGPHSVRPRTAGVVLLVAYTRMSSGAWSLRVAISRRLFHRQFAELRQRVLGIKGDNLMPLIAKRRAGTSRHQ